MPLKLDIPDPLRAVDPYAVFNTPYTKQLLDAFRAGARLSVWRWSTPWNYFLDNGHDANHLYVLGNCREYEKRVGLDSEHLRALQALACLDETSPRRITQSQSWLYVGLPEQEWWRYDPEKAAKAEAAWAEACARRDDWQATPYAFAPKLDALSPVALALLRTLHAKGGRIVYRPELHADLEALRRQGWLVMHDDGLLSLVKEARQVRLPRGQQLDIDLWFVL